jgi:hypothetical protein
MMPPDLLETEVTPTLFARAKSLSLLSTTTLSAENRVSATLGTLLTVSGGHQKSGI